jgi:hypothetical protein
VHINIAADGRDRGELLQRIQNERVAHVSGVEDMFDPAQSRDCLRSEQAVSVRNNPDQRVFANTVLRWDQLCAAVLSTPGTQSPRARGPGLAGWPRQVQFPGLNHQQKCYSPINSRVRGSR